jgi:TPR repeat protein
VLSHVQAVARGHRVAQCELGRALLSRPDGSAWTRAFGLFLPADSQRIASATVLAGFCLLHGIGVDVDSKAADKHFSDTRRREPLADAICSERGIDPADGSSLSQAIAQDEQSTDPLARYQLALCYADGRGVQRNLQKAIDLFRGCSSAVARAELEAKRIGTSPFINPSPSRVCVRSDAWLCLSCTRRWSAR